MDKLNSKKPIYPLISFIACVCTLACGLIFVKNPNIVYFYIGIYLLHLICGNWKACIAILPMLAIMGSFFGVITYLVGGDKIATTQAVYRSVAVCLAFIPGLSTQTHQLVKSLRQLNMPKALTLGMMVTISFLPLLQSEMKQIRDAMKTRGCVSIFHPKVIYRSFLIPLVIRVVNISETLSLSVETRGFTLEKSQTEVFQPIKIKSKDVAFVLSFLMISVGAFML